MARPPSSASRDEVLLAALTLLRDEGPNGLTVRAVAAAAGCSTMAVYTHFDGKAGLVDAILADGHASLTSSLAEGAATNAYGDVLVSVAMAYRAWALSNPTQYQAMYSELVPGFAPSPGTVEVAQAGNRAHVERVAQELRVDLERAERIARHLWWSVHGHVLFELYGLAYGGDGDAEFLEAARWLRHGVEL